MNDDESALTAFQVKVARAFLDLPASDGFLLAGGIRDGDTFCRLLLHGPEDLLIDVALDSEPGRPATVSFLGPTFAVEELAGRKIVALFDRAAARDFVDVYMLARRFPKDTLLALALEVDAGFDVAVFAEMAAHIDRYCDADLDLGGVSVSELRAFFRDWIADLRALAERS